MLLRVPRVPDEGSRARARVLLGASGGANSGADESAGRWIGISRVEQGKAREGVAAVRESTHFVVRFFNVEV